MIAPTLKKKIHDTLKSAYFSEPDDVVEVRDGEVDDLHLRIVSRKFIGMGPLKRTDLVWSILEDRLKHDEWGQITMTETAAPRQNSKSLPGS
jgi:stress-induced morphogen